MRSHLEKDRVQLSRELTRDSRRYSSQWACGQEAFCAQVLFILIVYRGVRQWLTGQIWRRRDVTIVGYHAGVNRWYFWRFFFSDLNDKVQVTRLNICWFLSLGPSQTEEILFGRLRWTSTSTIVQQTFTYLRTYLSLLRISRRRLVSSSHWAAFRSLVMHQYYRFFKPWTSTYDLPLVYR